MNYNEINLIASQLKIPNFCGVFGLDELKQIHKQRNGLIIFNTQPTTLPGQHWIALCTEDIFYFDSLNSGFHSNDSVAKFLIKMNRNLIFNNIKIQSNTSNLCGVHCLVFCHIMSQNNTMSMFQSFMTRISNVNVFKREQLSFLYFNLSNMK